MKNYQIAEGIRIYEYPCDCSNKETLVCWLLVHPSITEMHALSFPTEEEAWEALKQITLGHQTYPPYNPITMRYEE